MQTFLLVPLMASTMDVMNDSSGVSKERVSSMFRLKMSCSRWLTFRRNISSSSWPLVRMDAPCSSKTLVSCAGEDAVLKTHNITSWNLLPLWHTNVHYRIHEGAPLDSFSFCTIDSSSSQRVSPTINFNNILPKWSFPFMLRICSLTCGSLYVLCVRACTFLARSLSWMETGRILTIQTFTGGLLRKTIKYCHHGDDVTGTRHCGVRNIWWEQKKSIKRKWKCKSYTGARDVSEIHEKCVRRSFVYCRGGSYYIVTLCSGNVEKGGGDFYYGFLSMSPIFRVSEGHALVLLG
jgi:hypothetical protein